MTKSQERIFSMLSPKEKNFVLYTTMYIRYVIQKIAQLVTDENVLLPTTDFHQVLNGVRSVLNRAFYDVCD